ncbi:MAG: histidine triad family protein [Bacteriovoracaceae bacterium]|nr:histidine triad family protein [Bacteriovoracaceae bacterium]
MSCLFCEIPKENIVKSTERVFAIKDRYPVTEGHLLIIPKAHRVDFFQLTSEELKETNELLRFFKDKILKDDPRVTGFNIGANCGEDAGQTILHSHIHLIPRRKGDDPSPRGGVRAVVPGKKSYSA